MGEIIQFIPRPRHDRDDIETMAIKMARQLIEFAKEGQPPIQNHSFTPDDCA